MSERYKAAAERPTRPAKSGRKPGTKDEKLKQFLQIEARVRMASSKGDLLFIIANETLKLVGARQCFVFSGTARQKLKAVSTLPGIHSHSPLAAEFEQTVRFLGEENGLASIRRFEIPPTSNSTESHLSGYPFRNLTWVPFCDGEKKLLGGMLLARERPWAEADTIILTQIANVYSYSLDFFKTKAEKRLNLSLPTNINRKYLIAAAVLTSLAMVFPVSMKTQAPFEIAAKDPFIVSSYIDGVIDEILVEPGQAVLEGQPVVRFSDTLHKNALEIANRELAVSQARLKRANQMAFDSEDGRKELGLAMADIALKRAKLDLAEDQSRHTIIRAAKSGVAIYPDKQKLVGKPVTVGEQIMSIANDQNTEVKIHLPVSDSIFLNKDARVVLFLDSDPVNSREAVAKYINYQPSLTSTGNLAYGIIAELEKSGARAPKLGVQGTAQIYGKTVPLLLYVFRRPLTYFRQWIGW